MTTDEPRIPTIDPTLRLDLKAAIESMPSSVLLGIQIVGFSAGGMSLLQMPIRPAITFDGSTVQGGIVGVLADYAGVSAAASTLAQGWSAATTGFEVHNLAAARGTRLVAVGTAVRVGRTSAVSRAEVYVESPEQTLRLVCLAVTTCVATRLSVE